jgi:hypothetical protein
MTAKDPVAIEVNKTGWRGKERPMMMYLKCSSHNLEAAAQALPESSGTIVLTGEGNVLQIRRESQAGDLSLRLPCTVREPGSVTIDAVPFVQTLCDLSKERKQHKSVVQVTVRRQPDAYLALSTRHSTTYLRCGDPPACSRPDPLLTLDQEADCVVQAQDLHRTADLVAAPLQEEGLLFLRKEAQSLVASAQDGSCLLSYSFPCSVPANRRLPLPLQIRAQDVVQAAQSLPYGNHLSVACTLREDALVLVTDDRAVQIPLCHAREPLPEKQKDREALSLVVSLEQLFGATKRVVAVGETCALRVVAGEALLCAWAHGYERTIHLPAHLSSEQEGTYPLPAERLLRVLKALRRHITFDVRLSFLPDRSLLLCPCRAQQELLSYTAHMSAKDDDLPDLG